jgi:hypothetical protein
MQLKPKQKSPSRNKRPRPTHRNGREEIIEFESLDAVNDATQVSQSEKKIIEFEPIPLSTPQGRIVAGERQEIIEFENLTQTPAASQGNVPTSLPKPKPKPKSKALPKPTPPDGLATPTSSATSASPTPQVHQN